MNIPPPKVPNPAALAREVRELMRAQPVASLATSLQGSGPAQGWPYASLVLIDRKSHV